jgi:hypothetical protein
MTAAFCSSCGKPLPPLSAYCPTCGNRLVQGVTESIKQEPMPTKTAIRHIKLIEYVALAGGILLILVGIVNALPGPGGREPFSWLLAADLAGVCHVFAFVGLRQFRQWGRVLIMLLSIVWIACPFSWYVLYIMLRRDTNALFVIESSSTSSIA